MNKAMKLKATWISTDGGLTWLCTRQYYLSEVETRVLQSNTFEGRTFTVNKEGTEHDNRTRTGQV